MTAWLLIGYLSLTTSSSYGGGGPFAAEFATEQACRAAVERIVKNNELALQPTGVRRAICVPKGDPS